MVFLCDLLGFRIFLLVLCPFYLSKVLPSFLIDPPPWIFRMFFFMTFFIPHLF